MTDTDASESAFIRYLTGLAERDDRAALAALRRGLGRPPGTAPELYPHVARFFPSDAAHSSRSREDAMFIVAALFGLLPTHRAGSGSPVRALRRLNLESESTERRVLSLLNADAVALPIHLRHLFALIRGHAPDQHLDYDRLLRHVTQWDHPDRWVQRQWARDWWAASVPPTYVETLNQPESEETTD